jgi:carnitine O-acetyltransferase
VKLDAVLNPPTKLNWTTDAKILDSIEKAKVFASKLIADSDVVVHEYQGYGSDYIKKEGSIYEKKIYTFVLTNYSILVKVSPDAFIQMVLQLTYFRIHKNSPAVYETASTRKYLHGRTETCRSLSVDSAELCRKFHDSSVPVYFFKIPTHYSILFFFLIFKNMF